MAFCGSLGTDVCFVGVLGEDVGGRTLAVEGAGEFAPWESLLMASTLGADSGGGNGDTEIATTLAECA